MPAVQAITRTVQGAPEPDELMPPRAHHTTYDWVDLVIWWYESGKSGTQQPGHRLRLPHTWTAGSEPPHILCSGVGRRSMTHILSVFGQPLAPST